MNKKYKIKLNYRSNENKDKEPVWATLVGFPYTYIKYKGVIFKLANWVMPKDEEDYRDYYELLYHNYEDLNMEIIEAPKQ